MIHFCKSCCIFAPSKPKHITTMSKAILLVRVSTDQQDLTQQTEKVREEALRDGYSDNDIIVIEDKESAVKLSEEERNGLNMLKHYVEHDDVDCVYSYEVSRISRQPAMLYNIRDYLIKHNVQLIILNPYMKMLDEEGNLSVTGNLFFSIFTGMAENEGYLRKSRMKRGRDRKRKLGEYYGGNIPMGYHVVNDKFEIEENEAKIVRRIFDEYISGKSLMLISQEMLDAGTWKTKITTLLGMKQNIVNMLNRKAYCGDKFHPAIISHETFEAARKKAQDKRFYPKGNEDVSLFRGMLHDKNGNTLVTNIKTKYYFTKGVTVSFKTTDTIIWGLAREWYLQIYENKRSEILETLEAQVLKQENIIRTMRDNITNNQDKIDRISERYIEGKLSKQRADELEHRTFNELYTYKAKMEDAQVERQRLLDLIKNDKTMIAITDTLTIAEKRSIVNYIIKSITVQKLSFYVTEFVIENKITGEIMTIVYNTRKCEILEMEVIAQQALPPA